MGLAKKIAENFLWRGIYLVSLFIINLLMARVLGAGESGRFFLLMTNLALIILVTGFCLESSIVFYGASGKIAFNKLATIGLLWSIPATIIAGIFLWYGWPPEVTNREMLFMALYVFSFLLINNFTGLFHAHQNFTTCNQLLAVVNVFFICYVIFFIGYSFFSKENQEINAGIIRDKIKWGYIITVFVQGIVLLVTSWNTLAIKKWILPSASEMRLLLRYAGLSLCANIVFFLVSRAGYWFVEYYCNAGSLGNYIQVSRLGQIFILPSIIVAGSLFPQTAGGQLSFQSNSFSLLSRSLIVIYLSAIVLSVLIGKPVISFLWGNEYDEMYRAWLFYVPGVLFLAVSYLFSPIFAGKGKVKYNIIIGLFALVVVATCSYFLIPLWGIRGAAVASSAGFMIMMILYFIIAKIKFGFSFLAKNEFFIKP